MKSLRMKSSAENTSSRLFYLDWLRILVVLGVFLAHDIDALDVINWNIKYQARSVGLLIFTNLGSQWGMSLLFFLAGATAWFGLGSRASKQFVNDRIKRLAIPFLVGLLVLSPPEAYFTALRRSLYHGSFFQFYPTFFADAQVSWDLHWLLGLGYHLWFLAFLFLVSVSALPLLLWLWGAAGQRLVSFMERVSLMPAGMLMLGFPLILVQILLRAPFPGYQGWADFASWYLCFLYGYILISRPQFVAAIKHQGELALFTGLACLLVILVLYFNGFVAGWEMEPHYTVGYVFYQALRGLVMWSFLLFILVFAMRFLNVSNRLCSYANEAVLPFYIVHYPIIVLVVFFTIPWHFGTISAFFLTSTLSFIVTLVAYEFLIRRIPALRWVFGMKPLHPAKGNAIQQAPF